MAVMIGCSGLTTQGDDLVHEIGCGLHFAESTPFEIADVLPLSYDSKEAVDDPFAMEIFCSLLDFDTLLQANDGELIAVSILGGQENPLGPPSSVQVALTHDVQIGVSPETTHDALITAFRAQYGVADTLAITALSSLARRDQNSGFNRWVTTLTIDVPGQPF